MTVWADVKALYGEGGLEVVTAVAGLSIRTIIQPDADSMTWLPDFTRPDVDTEQFDRLWWQHQQAIGRRLAWLNRLAWLIKKGGMLLVPLPFILTVIVDFSRGAAESFVTSAVGLAASTLLYLLRRRLLELVARLGGRFLQNRVRKHLQNFTAGKFTPANYGLEA